MTILYKDKDILIVNKQIGESVQSDKTGDITLIELIKKELSIDNQFVGLTHRIDKPASGIVLFALNPESQQKINWMFEHGKIKKTYWAVVGSQPIQKERKLVHYITFNAKINKSFAFDSPQKNSQEAALNYRLINFSERYFLLEIDLLTGRHHQIRCQLAQIGSPIKGDLKYGAPRSNKNGGIYLHAREISFSHPNKKIHIKIAAPLPEDNLWKALEI